jgi:hypothetical protein
MTNHYNIQVAATDTHFKATYRDGKFKKLEHLRGPLDDATVKYQGRLVPRLESRIQEWALAFTNRVVYTKQETIKSLFTQFVDEWHSFFETFAGMPPKFTGMDGKSIKSIITYLTKLGGNETEALVLWKLILQKWDTLNDFHKQNTDLKYINSKLNIIIHAIKQQNNTIASSTNGSIEL